MIAVVSGLLSAVGIYSLMSFLTGRRAREMGVRMALGATRRDVVRLAYGPGGEIGGGRTGARPGLRVSGGLEAALFGVITGNAPLAGGVALALGVIAIVASYVPARRVSRVEPTIALRSE